MLKIIFVYILVINIFAFLAYGLDKMKAKRDKWRIKESFLLTLPLLGGPYGSIFGMNIFRHKTQKFKFNAINYTMVIIWTILLTWLYIITK